MEVVDSKVDYSEQKSLVLCTRYFHGAIEAEPAVVGAQGTLWEFGCREGDEGREGKDDKRQLNYGMEGRAKGRPVWEWASRPSREDSSVHTYVRVTASRKYRSTYLGAKPRGRKKTVPGVGKKPTGCREIARRRHIHGHLPC